MKCQFNKKVNEIKTSNKKNENKKKELKRLDKKKIQCDVKYETTKHHYRIINLDDKIRNSKNSQYRQRINLRKFINTIKSIGYIKINKVTDELILEIIDYFNLKVSKDKNPIEWFKNKHTKKF